MIAGHFGFAAAVKARERSTPLWMLMLATVWLDIAFIPFLMAKIETVEPVAGRNGYGLEIIHADYTHSVVGMLVLSAALGAISWPFWGRRSALVICLTAVSHWVLDLLVHRADMPILPGNLLQLPRLGLGLWQYPAVSAALEAALVIGGAWMYWRAANDVCRKESTKAPLATLTSLLIAGAGLAVLGMDLAA